MGFDPFGCVAWASVPEIAFVEGGVIGPICIVGKAIYVPGAIDKAVYLPDAISKGVYIPGLIDSGEECH